MFQGPNDDGNLLWMVSENLFLKWKSHIVNTARQVWDKNHNRSYYCIVIRVFTLRNPWSLELTMLPCKCIKVIRTWNASKCCFIKYPQDCPFNNYCRQEVLPVCKSVKPVFTLTYFAEYGTRPNNTCVVCLSVGLRRWQPVSKAGERDVIGTKRWIDQGKCHYLSWFMAHRPLIITH